MKTPRHIKPHGFSCRCTCTRHIAGGVINCTEELSGLIGINLGGLVGEGPEYRIHEGSLGCDEARLLLVGLVVFQILAAVANVPIATHHHVGVAASRLGKQAFKHVHKAVLFILLLGPGTTAGQIQRSNRHGRATKLGAPQGRLDVAAGILKSFNAHRDVIKLKA